MKHPLKKYDYVIDMIEYQFEVTVEVDGQEYNAEGTVSYGVRDNSFTYDYGELTNQVHNPGDSVEDAESVLSCAVCIEDDKEVPIGSPFFHEVTKAVDLYWETEAGEDELLHNAYREV